MKKLILAEYQGRRDTEGKAVGHAPKVLGEYAALTGDDFELSIMAPRCILEAASAPGRKNAKILPHSILMKSGNSLFEKIWNKVKMFANIDLVLRSDAADEIWFFNTEFYLMLYLALFGNRGKRLVCTLFMERFGTGMTGRIKQLVFERAQKKMSLIISAGKSFSFKNVPYTFIPDYYCCEDEYTPYRRPVRKRQAVCLGTMGSEKQIEEMVGCFSALAYPLIVAGRFYDKERLQRLKASAGSNISIRDEYLSRREYLSLLGESSYVVLPYAPSQYGTQTSGVLQEAVFMDTIPVSYKGVLDGNGVAGIGFDSWDGLRSGTDPEHDLYADNADLHDNRYYTDEYARLRKEVYSRESMKNRLCKSLELS